MLSEKNHITFHNQVPTSMLIITKSQNRSSALRRVILARIDNGWRWGHRGDLGRMLRITHRLKAENLNLRSNLIGALKNRKFKSLNHRLQRYQFRKRGSNLLHNLKNSLKMICSTMISMKQQLLNLQGSNLNQNQAPLAPSNHRP